MNQAVFPTVWKASNQSKTCWGLQWTTLHRRDKRPMRSFSSAPRNTALECHRAGTHSHQWVKPHNMKQARGHQSCQQNVSISHVFAWIFEIFFLKQVRDITGEFAISWIYTRCSAQNGLVWYMDCTEEIAFSRYHCTKKEKLRVALKRKTSGRQLWISLLMRCGGKGSKDTSVMTALLTNMVILGFNLNRW